MSVASQVHSLMRSCLKETLCLVCGFPGTFANMILPEGNPLPGLWLRRYIAMICGRHHSCPIQTDGTSYFPSDKRVQYTLQLLIFFDQ